MGKHFCKWENKAFTKAAEPQSSKLLTEALNWTPSIMWIINFKCLMHNVKFISLKFSTFYYLLWFFFQRENLSRNTVISFIRSFIPSFPKQENDFSLKIFHKSSLTLSRDISGEKKSFLKKCYLKGHFSYLVLTGGDMFLILARDGPTGWDSGIFIIVKLEDLCWVGWEVEI